MPPTKNLPARPKLKAKAENRPFRSGSRLHSRVSVWQARRGDWSSSEIKEAQKYGRLQGIPEEYLDFKVYFKPHENKVHELSK